MHKQNYHSIQGHCLVIGFHITWWDFLTTVTSSTRKVLGRRKDYKSTMVCTIGINFVICAIKKCNTPASSQRRLYSK